MDRVEKMNLGSEDLQALSVLVRGLGQRGFEGRSAQRRRRWSGDQHATLVQEPKRAAVQRPRQGRANAGQRPAPS